MEFEVSPLLGLVLTTPRLELRSMSEADIPALSDAAQSGIHDPDDMPFEHPFTDAPRPDFDRNFYRFYWHTRASAGPEQWVLPFTVLDDGQPIGCQDVRAEQFPTLRTVSSGSWLCRDRQGQGYGKEMRAAILALAFDHFGAEVATSESVVTNAPSIRVSRALGYEENGTGRIAPRGEPLDTICWRLTRERYRTRREAGTYPEVTVSGAEACQPLLGLAG